MSGIKITKALYGTGSQTVDVATAVTSNIKDGVLNLVVTPDALNIPDPAPGQQKTLNVSYTINNGKTMTQSVVDNGVLMISAPPERLATGLLITKAQYGYTGNFTDVTDAIQKQVKDGSINITVGYKAAGIPDPNPNQQKSLEVDYTLNGASNSVTLKDGQTFNVSAPPLEQASNKKPSDYVGELIGVVFSNLFRMAGVFFYVLSIYATADFFGAAPIPTGSVKDTLTQSLTTSEGRMRTGYLLLGAILPGVAYWGLPWYVFVRRLFSSDYALA